MEREQHTDISSTPIHPPIGATVIADALPAHESPSLGRSSIGPLFISVLLHAFLLLCIFSLRVDPKTKTNLAITPVRLQLLPPRRDQEFVPVEPPLSTAIEPPLEPKSTEPVSASRQIELPQTPALLPAPEAEAPLPGRDTLSPTTLHLRQIVETIRREEEEAAVFIVCTEVQRRNPMLNCVDELFAVAPTSSTPAAEAAKMQRMARSLRDSGMSIEDIDHYLQDLDMTTRDSATSGDTRATALKDQMFQNDSTYQLMKRVLNP